MEKVRNSFFFFLSLRCYIPLLFSVLLFLCCHLPLTLASLHPILIMTQEKGLTCVIIASMSPSKPSLLSSGGAPEESDAAGRGGA